MKSLSFPNIFNKVKNNVNLVYDKEAIIQNLQLLLLTTKSELLGDPYCGTNLKSLLFNLNDAILKDLVIDEIFSIIKICMPMVQVERKDINIIQEKGILKAEIRLKYTLDNSWDLTIIPLMVGVD